MPLRFESTVSPASSISAAELKAAAKWAVSEAEAAYPECLEAFKERSSA